MCKLTRMRLGLEPPDARLTASMFPANLTRRIRAEGAIVFAEKPRRAHNRAVMTAPQSPEGASARMSVQMLVPTIRADTLWRRVLGSRHIDFLKIDVDADWRQIGLVSAHAATFKLTPRAVVPDVGPGCSSLLRKHAQVGLLKRRAATLITIEVRPHGNTR